jgi:hypothetical protein
MNSQIKTDRPSADTVVGTANQEPLPAIEQSNKKYNNLEHVNVNKR